MNAVTPRTRLRQEFQQELHGYYQMHGEKNGSPIEGTIYPPDIKPNDDVALQSRVDELSDFLSQKEAINFRPTPDWGNGRISDRAEVAAAASGWVKASGHAALQAATDLIMDPAIKAMVHQGLETCDAEFYTAPSSKSGMFHPADEINEGGLALHTARVVQMGEYLGDFFDLNDREKDTLRAGLILHDSVKGGEPWKGYANEHGELAGKLIMGLDGPEDVKKTAAQIASNHMAVWRQTPNGEPNPAVPDNKMDMITSLADYLAARDNIYLDVPGLDKTVPPTIKPEDRMKPQTYTGTTRNSSKAFPRGMEVTMEGESLTIRTVKNTYTARLKDKDDAFVTYQDLKPTEDGPNELDGMDLKANFWLLNGAGGGKVILNKGDREAMYFVRPPKK